MTEKENERLSSEKKKRSEVRWFERSLSGEKVEIARKLKNAFKALDEGNFSLASKLFLELLEASDISELFRARILAWLALSEYRLEGFCQNVRERFFQAAITHADTLERLLAYYTKKFDDHFLSELVRKYIKARASQDIY